MLELDIVLARDPRPAIVRLRVAIGRAAEAAALLDLPRFVGQMSVGPVDRLWLGPDQWLLVSFERTAAELIELCERNLVGMRFHAVEVSAALDRIVVRGPRTRMLLAMGSGIDCAAEALPVGTCVRTRFARIAVVLIARDTDAFELVVDRSHCDYLERWLARAATDPLLIDEPADGRR